MSLWRYRRQILEAVGGELPAPAEARLREHLGRCARCRAFYDSCRALTDTARGTAGPVASAARERARLAAALGGAAPRAPTKAPARWRWLVPIGLAVPAAAVAVVLLMRAPAPPAADGEEIAWRGLPAGEKTTSLTLRFYARGRSGSDRPAAVRLLGELPGSGELRAATGEEIQIAYTQLGEPQHLALLSVDEGGEVRRLYPAASAPEPGPLPTAREPRLLGPPLALGGARPGTRVRLYAVVSRSAQSLAEAEKTLRLQARQARHPLPAASFGGTLWIEP